MIQPFKMNRCNVKGVIFDLKKYSLHDGPGIRTTVFFKGCPLKCWWCHNPESRNPNPQKMKSGNRKSKYSERCSDDEILVGKEVSVEEIMTEIKKDILFYDESSGGVTFSGGEALMQPQFLMQLLIECKKIDLHTTVDTTGYASYEIFEKINPYVDLYLFDLKIIDSQKHKKYTGVDNFLILENLEKLNLNGTNIRIRLPLIPDITDTNENIESTAKTISNLNFKSIDILPFNEIGKSKYPRLEMENRLEEAKVQSDEKIKNIEKLFEKYNIKVKIRG